MRSYPHGASFGGVGALGSEWALGAQSSEGRGSAAFRRGPDRHGVFARAGHRTIETVGAGVQIDVEQVLAEPAGRC